MAMKCSRQINECFPITSDTIQMKNLVKFYVIKFVLEFKVFFSS